MEDIEYLDEYKDLVLPGIKVGEVRQSGGARRRRISSDSSNSSSLDADIFQKLFLDKSVDDDLLNLTEGASSKSQSRRHRSPSSSDDSSDALDALFNRKLKSKPSKRRERFSSFDSVDDLGQALMRSTQRLTVPKPSTSQSRAKKSHSDALYRSSSSSSNSSARGMSSTRKPKPAAASSRKSAASAAPGLTGKYKNPSKPNSVNGSSHADKGKAVTILKAQKTDLKPPKHEPKSDPLNLTEFFEDSDSDSSYTYESDFFDDHDSADEDAEPVIDISTDTSRTTSVADTVTPVVSDDDGQEPQREQNEESEQNGQKERSQQESIMNSVYERLQSYLNNLSCAEAPPIYKKQSFAKKSRSFEKKPSSSEQVKHAKERSAASGEVQEEKERDQDREPTKTCGSSHSSPAKSPGRTSNSLEEKPGASRRLFEVDDGLTLETLQRMTQDLAEQILEIDVERSVEYQKRSGSKHRSRSRSKISGEPGTASDLATTHVRKLTYSSERIDSGCEQFSTELRRSKSESAFPKRARSQEKKERKTRAATTEDNVLSSAKEGDGEVPVPVKKKRGRPRKKTFNRKTLEKAKSTECVLEPEAKEPEVSVETSEVEAVKGQEELGQQEAPNKRELNSELEKAKDFTPQDDTSISSCHQETDLTSGPDRSSALEEQDAVQNLKEQPQPTVDISAKSFDTAMETGEVTESVSHPQELDNKECVPQSEKIEKEHCNNVTMAIKDLEEIENAIETAGEIAMTPELADALDGSTNVQATPVAGNILEESDSQLAEDIKLAEEILAAEVGKGIEVTEAATATAVGDQNSVIDIVKELEQETITEVVGNSEELCSPKAQTEAEEQSPNKEKTPIKDKTPAKGKSPAKGQSSAKKQFLTKSQSPGKGNSKRPSLVAEQSLGKGQSTATENSEVQGPSTDEEQSEAEGKSSVIEAQEPTKESLTDTENPPRLDTPTKKSNPSSPAKELGEFKGSSIARRILRSDKPESKMGTPETSPSQKTSRKSRGKLPLKSDISLLKDDFSRRSSPRLGRSPAESHSSQERSKLTNEKSITETKSPEVEIETKDTSIVEASNPVKDVPVTDSTTLTEEKPGSDETDANKVDVKPSRKRGGKQKINMTKSTEELSYASELIDGQPTSSEPEQIDEPTEIKAVNTSELPEERPKASEPPAENSDADKIDQKPSSSRKSRSRRSRWDQGKPESSSATESSEVERDKIQLRTSKRGTEPDATPNPAKSHSSKDRVTTKKTSSKTEKSKEKESSRDRKVKSDKNIKDKPARDTRVDDCSDQTETETKQLTEVISYSPLSSEHISLTATYSVENVPQSPFKAESANVKDKHGRINRRRHADSVEDSENDTPSEMVPLSTIPGADKTADETQIKEGKGNQSPSQKGDTMLDTEPLPPMPPSKESEEEVTASVHAEIMLKSPSKAESAEVEDKPAVSGLKRGRINKRKQPVSVEGAENDQIEPPSQTVPLSSAITAAETQINEGEGNQSPNQKGDTMLDTEPLPPMPPSKESEKEAPASEPTENVPQSPSKAESTEVEDKPDVSGVKRRRINRRRQAVPLEDSENDTPSETVPLSNIHGDAKTAAETQINVGKINQSPTQKGDEMLDTESLPPPHTSREAEKEAVSSGPQRKSKKKKRKSTKRISASATDCKESVSITTPAEPMSPNTEAITEESAQTDAKNTSSNSPSKFKDNVSEEVSESIAKPNSPSTSLHCRKLRVMLKRTPIVNLIKKGKTVSKKGISKKRKKLNKRLETIKEGAVSDLVDTQNKPDSESQPASESDPVPDTNAPKSGNIPNLVKEEVTKQAIDTAICDVTRNVPKKAATKKVTHNQDKVENMTQKHEAVSETTSDIVTTTEAPAEQDHEPSNPSGTDELLKEKTTKKETQKEEKIHEKEETCQAEDTSTAKETPEDGEIPHDVETPTDEETLEDKETPGKEGSIEDSELSEEPLIPDPDLLAKDITTEEPENALAESPAGPTPDPDLSETETTGVTVVAPEASTNSGAKRSMRKREADSSQPDEANKVKLQMTMKANLARKRELLKNASRRNQPEEKDHPALKRTKTDTVASKANERGKTISMIGNETIMTSPSNVMRSEQPQTSQAAKRTGAASKGTNYAEITKHVIIPASDKKPVDGKPSGCPTKKPMVQTTLNLRKLLPGEGSISASTLTLTSGSGSAALGRKSMGKAEVEASKPKSQSTLNNSLVVTRKAVLPASKKNEPTTIEDKSSAIGLRKVNISVSLVPPKDNSANNSSLNKSLETSPVAAQKIKLAEAQKTARKPEVKKKVEPKGAAPETPPLSALEKNKPKVNPKSEMAVDNSAKKMDSSAVPARRSLQVEVPKKTETRKSEGESLNSRKASLNADTSRKIETRKSEGTRKVILPKGSVAKELEPRKSAEFAKATKSVEAADAPDTEEFETGLKNNETASKSVGEQRKESSGAPRIEKPTVAVTPRTVNLAKSIPMTRAASSSRSLAPTPAPVGEGEPTASKEPLPSSSTQTQPDRPGPSGREQHVYRSKGRFKRIPAAQKRKALEAAKASDPKRAKEEQQQIQGGSDPDQAFPVRITAAGLSQQVDPLLTSSMASLDFQKQAVAKPPAHEVKHRKLRIRINRHVVSQWLKDHQAKEALAQKAPAPEDDVASETESAAESMPESSNSTRIEPPVAVLTPPSAPIKDFVVPPVVATKAATHARAQDSATTAPVPPTPVSSAPVTPTPVTPASVSPAPVIHAPVPPVAAPPAPAPAAPVLPAPVPLAPAPLASVQPTPAPVPATKPEETPVVPPLTAEKGPPETRALEDARRLSTLKKVQMRTILPMPLPVPIVVAEVKSEPDDPPEPMEEPLPPVAAPPPVPEAPLVAEDTPPVGASPRQVISVISASTLTDRPAPNDIPSASAPGNNANSFGHTKMFSFLYPNRHSGNYGEVGLDFCCPNLEGPMAAIDPTRLHAKVEAPALEMPQFLVITTKFISKADKNIPNKVRAKLELLGKDKELSSSDPPALAASASPVPISQSLPSTPVFQPSLPPTAASSSTPTPAVPASSIDSLTKQLPRGTTLTKKVHPPGAPVPPSASDSMAASLPVSLIKLPALCPTDQQRTELQARVQVFDLVLQALSRRVANLTVAERQRTIEEIVKTSSLLPIDVDVGTKLLENYVHYLNKATTSTPVPPISPMPSEVRARSGISPATPVVGQLAPTVATSSTPALPQNIASPATPTATPQSEAIVIRKPVFDQQKNIIGFKSVTSPNVKGTPKRKAAPGPLPAATSTPPAASTSSAAATASEDSRFVEVDSKTAKACQRQMIIMRTPTQKSAPKGSIIAIKAGSKAKITNAPVSKAPSPATRVPTARGPAAQLPASRSPATRGPPPLKPIASPRTACCVSSGTIVPPKLTRTENANVFLINQATHVEESILPDMNNVVEPMEAEIKGELDDTSEAII